MSAGRALILISLTRVGLNDSKHFQQITYQHIHRNTEEDSKQNHDKNPVVLAYRTVINIRNSRLAALHLIIYSTARSYYSLGRHILFHVGNNTSPGDIITVDIRQLPLKSHTGSNEVLMVFDSHNHHQTTTCLLVSHTVVIAQILSHTEGIAIFHFAHNDKHILYPALLVELIKVEIGRIKRLFVYIMIRVRHILRRVLQIWYRYILSVPYLRSPSKRDRQAQT